MIVRFLFVFVMLASSVFAQRGDRYALILKDPPTRTRQAANPRPDGRGWAGRSYGGQRALQETLAGLGIPVTGAIHTLLNAVFVSASPDRLSELRALPGVASVVRMAPAKRTLNKAVDLVNARAAWSALGGQNRAGAGSKIAIIDTGIDETHPGFQDASLQTPAGYPKGSGDDLKHATNKIIVVRSYMQQLAVFDGNPLNTRPDDLSAVDHVGHGTAMAMAAAGAPISSPLGAISGIAPEAWLGNYKVFGSPGVNDITFSDIVMTALDDAFNDGMDVAVLGLTIPSRFFMTDTGSACGNSDSIPCDPWTAEVENAVAGGMAVVVPAGNDGERGLGSINTPGVAPDAITVGASTNSHLVSSTLTVQGNAIRGASGDGPQVTGPLSGLLVDAATLGDNTACAPPNARADFKVVIADRGVCGFATKVNNAAAVGAVAVILVREAGVTALFSPSGLTDTGIPTLGVGSDSGALLRGVLRSNPNSVMTIDPTPKESLSQSAEARASFSSQGPSINGAAIKPELVAPGTSLYTATQNNDPNGNLFNTTRFTALDGTSIAAPLVAGAVALAKQAHPAFTAAQLKSAVTNTATTGLLDADGTLARATSVGAGKLNAAGAVATTIAAKPATVSFGSIVAGTTLPMTRAISLSNGGTGTANLQLAVTQRDADSKAKVAVSSSSVSIAAGQSTQVSLTLSGSVPNAGVYEGVLNVTGGPVALHIPYMYYGSDGVPASLVSIQGDDFLSNTGGVVELDFKVVDRFGTALANVPVAFNPSTSVQTADRVTEATGIAFANIVAGPQLGTQTITATSGTLQISFQGRTIPTPAIRDSGIVNAGSLQPGSGVAPGSYITIFGTGMAEGIGIYRTASLPLSLAGVSVSFDVQSRGLSLPGRLSYASPTQVNVQVPWELAGSSTVTIKVSLGNFQTQTVEVPVVPAAPAFFEYTDPGSGNLLAAALDEKFGLVSPSNPVQRGHIIQLFVNGLGAVDNQPASGAVSPAQPLATTRVSPTVSIGGQNAPVQFSGLTSCCVGLYQVNALVPAGLTQGLQTAVISISGVASKSTNIPVQ